METKTLFFEDDGEIPNNTLPLIMYLNAFSEKENISARRLKRIFAENDWGNAWKNGVYNYHHYHSITHEVLGIYAGTARLHLGGEEGEEVDVKADDIIIIPAGVGHKSIESSSDFGVVGAYPKGSEYDLKIGKQSERPEVLHNISKVPIPDTDPLQGREEGIIKIWKDLK